MERRRYRHRSRGGKTRRWRMRRWFDIGRGVFHHGRAVYHLPS